MKRERGLWVVESRTGPQKEWQIGNAFAAKRHAETERKMHAAAYWPIEFRLRRYVPEEPK